MSEYDTFAAAPVGQTDREMQVAEGVLSRFAEAVTYRNSFAQQWEEVASLVLPAHRGTFMYGAYSTPGDKKTDQQVDASGMMALHRFAAICDSLLTPRNSRWHALSANDEYVMKDRATRLWFEDTTRRLFRYRYDPAANFSSQNNANFEQLGAFGNIGMFVDRQYSVRGRKGLRYRSLPMGELFLFENHQGLVDEFIRWFRLTARQAYELWPDKFPEKLREPLLKGSLTKYDFLHHVAPRKTYDPDRLDDEGKPYKSCYVFMDGRTILQEGGYNSFPAAISRYSQAPGEVYGRGPAMLVLPALKTLNAQKRTFLKQGHRAADPVLLTADDGLVDFSMKPGALNKGGWSSDGKPLVGVLPTGDIQTSEEMMAVERSTINDAFLVSLFQILEETPQMSATEVIERVNEKGILIAPTMGRQQSEYLGPLIDRELDLLSDMGLLLPMPPRLKEAGGSYSVVYTSPLSRAARAQESAGFMRSVEGVKELVNITQDPSLLDRFNFDIAVPEIAEQQGVPENWMSSDAQVAAKRENRAQAQAKQQEIQAMPAQAAMMKAQAAAQKNGGGQQGPSQPGVV